MKKKISVIIAAYNEERHIENCLMTLLNQSQPPDELIIVDDGSTDSTWKILQSCKITHPQLKIYRKKHLEQATARNFGFTKSTGDILVFLDADYHFDVKFIEKLVAPIEQNRAVATFTKEEYIANWQNIWSRYWNMDRYLPSGRRMLPNTPDKTNNFRAITRKLFALADGFSETGYSTDVTVLNKLGLTKAGFAARGAICYHYNPDSLRKVFQGARRLGSKGGIELSLASFFIYSFANSLRKGLIQFINGNKAYLIFKIVFDIGTTLGLFERAVTQYIKKDRSAFIYGRQH